MTDAVLEADPGGQAHFDPTVPTPQAVLGVEIGARPLRHAEIVRYLEVIAGISPHVALARYGSTYEDRPLLRATIGAADSIARLDDLVAMTRRLGDPRGVGRHGGDVIPAGVWVGCSIHGDELSGGDAGVALAYRLAAGMDAETVRIRDRLLVHIDPSVNPDGRERSLAQREWYAGQTVDLEPTGIVHTLRWPYGRGNHYLFDLNRDLVPQEQRETRLRTAEFLRLCPQLVIELHEMGPDDTFLFASPGDPLNPHLPSHVGRWWERLGRRQAAELARLGVSSYRGEWNEVFYPGFMDVWPAYHGAVPVIFEQPATGGGAVRQRSGRVLSFADAVRNQLQSLRANLDVAATGAEDLIADWAEARRTAAAQEGEGGRAFLLSCDDPYRIHRLVETLLAQGIDVGSWPQSPRGIVVRLDQPAARLVRNLLDDDVPLPESFLAAERERLDRGQPGTLYDVTSWSLPLAAGVTATLVDVPTGQAGPADVSPVDDPDPLATSAFGFLLVDSGYQATAALLARNARLHVALDPFMHGRAWPRGTFLFVRGENDPRLSAVLESSTADPGVSLLGVDGPLTDDGPDLGGQRFPLLLRPSVAVLCGDGIDPTAFGAIWHRLDQVAWPHSRLDVHQLDISSLVRYSVLVLPHPQRTHDSYPGIDASILPSIRSWIASGGTLIAINGAAKFIAREETAISTVRVKANDAIRRYMPRGTMLWTEVDPTRWITAGADRRVAVMCAMDDVLDAPADVEVPARFAGHENVRASGLLWPEAADAIAGTPCITRESVGAGQVILFAIDPLFRGLMVASERLLLNAMFLGPGLGTALRPTWADEVRSGDATGRPD